MANPEIYAHTYWSHKGKYPAAIEALYKLVPAEGEIPGWSADHNAALETFRIAANCYYDLYNNGLYNRLKEFRKLFGSCGYKRGDELTEEIVNRVEDRMNEIIIQAEIEQGITVEGYEAKAAPNGAQAIQAEVDRLSDELASNHAKLTKAAPKPFVQLSGEDGNAFSIIGRCGGALKKAGQADKAKEFKDKAFASDSYDEVLRLAMEYCDVA